MKKSTTKRALFLSFVSMFLCFTMLLGTTYAWFTDSVTSDVNTIVAGNLDVELYHENSKANGKVDTTTKLFQLEEGQLWEPGAMVWEKLSVENAGNLALKYKLSFDAFEATEVEDANGAKVSFASMLKVAFLPKTDYPNFTPSRDSIKALDDSVWKKLETFVENGELAEGEKDIYTVVIYWMPSDNDNLFNMNNANKGKEVSVKVGVNLFATQKDAERDSFDEFYDKDTTLPETGSVSKNDSEPKNIKKNIVKVEIPGTAENGIYTLTVSTPETTTDGNETTIAFDIDLKRDGVRVSGTTAYTVSVELEKNLEVVEVTHNGTKVEAFSYDPTTGILIFTTTSFSPFTVTHKEADENSVFVPADPDAAEKLEKAEVVVIDEAGNEYASLKAAIDSGAAKIYVKEGADLGTITHLDIDHSVTIYGNGAYISGGERDFAIDTYKLLTNDITVTVYNLHGVAFWGQRNTAYTANLNLYNCNDVSRVYINGTSGVNNIALYNCTASLGNDVASKNLIGDTAVYSNANGSIVIDGCTFTNIGCPVNLNHKVAGEQTLVVTNSTFVDCATTGTAAYYAPIRLYNSVEGANQTLTVKGNAFTYSDGKAPINKTDVLLNAKHNGVDAAGTIEATVQATAKVAMGVNVDFTSAVYTAEDFLTLSEKAFTGNNGKAETYTIELYDDIDLNGADFSSVIAQRGDTLNFVGNGHTISGVNIVSGANDNSTGQAGMFYCYPNSTLNVSDLVLKDITVTADESDNGYAAAVVGYCEGNAVLNNVDVVNATINGEKSSGMLVGHLSGSIVATNCEVDGKVVLFESTFEPEGHYAGKLVGTIAGNATLNNVSYDVTVGGSLKSSNVGEIFGRQVSGKLVVDGYEIIADGLGVKNSKEYAVFNANGLATLNGKMVDKSAGRDTVVNLMADIDFTGKTWTPVDSHADSAFEIAEINGNGYTIKNLTINGQAMFTRFAGFGDVVIKDITFDGANVNSNGSINTSILTVQSYQNVLLDNVDVKNSTITGGYKVAPLIATVYNESSSTVTATLKNCDVSDTVVTATSYDFCTTGMVAFVYEGDNDKAVFENCTVTNVKLYAPAVYESHAWVYVNDADTDDCFNEVEGVTVTNCTFENK